MRWLCDIRKYPVGSDGGSGFRLIWLHGVHQAVKSTEEGLAQPWQSHSLVPVPHPCAAASPPCPDSSCCGWHRVLHGERAAALYPREGTMPKDLKKQQERLYRPTKAFKEKSAVLHEWLLQLQWHSILTELSLPSKCCLYVFNRNLLTLPALAFIICSESTLLLDLYNNNAECLRTKTSFIRLARN